MEKSKIKPLSQIKGLLVTWNLESAQLIAKQLRENSVYSVSVDVARDIEDLITKISNDGVYRFALVNSERSWRMGYVEAIKNIEEMRPDIIRGIFGFQDREDIEKSRTHVFLPLPHVGSVYRDFIDFVAKNYPAKQIKGNKLEPVCFGQTYFN